MNIETSTFEHFFSKRDAEKMISLLSKENDIYGDPYNVVEMTMKTTLTKNGTHPRIAVLCEFENDRYHYVAFTSLN